MRRGVHTHVLICSKQVARRWGAGRPQVGFGCRWRPATHRVLPALHARNLPPPPPTQAGLSVTL